MKWRVERPFLISAGLAFLLVAAWLQPDIRDFLVAHHWWRAFFLALPPLIVAAGGIFVQWRQSAHADELQEKANEFEEQANQLRKQANELTKQIGDLQAERNTHLQQIAENTRRERTKAEKNVEILRKHIGARASVTDNVKYAPTTPLIAEINEQDIVALFMPAGGGSQAYCVNVYAGDLDVTDLPEGGCAVRLSIIRRHGAVVDLGQITRWEDRSLPAATAVFNKGGLAYRADYSKPGSAETRALRVFGSRDGANSFLLERSIGDDITGDNVEISKRFMVLHIEYRAAGFGVSNWSTGVSQHSLFISV